MAIVIPVYRHSVLLVDAVTAALQQATTFDFCVVIVNDGCPLIETHQACLEFTLGELGRVFYVRRSNGGLSAARNSGIRYAIGSWPSIEAIYLLDADNIILPGSLERAFRALKSSPEIAWVYPNIDMFGQEWTADFGGDYSVLRHLGENICEAGSMIRRVVFEKGIWFDETMRLGFEDWDFWLSAAKAGFRGKFLPNFGFRYRRRPESMVRDSERDRSEIEAYLRRKHAALLTPRNLIALENAEAPRFAFCLVDKQEVQITSDPAAASAHTEPFDRFVETYFRGKLAPARHHRPYFLAFTDSATLEAIKQDRLLYWLIWQFEGAVEQYSFAYLRVSFNDRDKIEFFDAEADASEVSFDHRRANLLMTTTQLLDECLDDPLDSWIMSIEAPTPQPKIYRLHLSLPSSGTDQPSHHVNTQFLAFFQKLRSRRGDYHTTHADAWRPPGLGPKAELFRVSRQVLGGAPIYPKLRNAASRDVGFLISVAEFGGVEKVAYNIARVLRDNGWQPHLFVFGRRRCSLAHWVKELFASINFFNEPGLGEWDENNRFFGAHYTRWTSGSSLGHGLGLLCGLDVVINCHCADAHALMGPLRRMGTKTVAALHVTDLSPAYRPSGHTYLSLGYEHAYDVITCCSRSLKDWCHTMGIPQEKLTLVWNAPSFSLSPGRLHEILAVRQKRRAGQPLQVMFLGRFDEQKGLDRLIRMVTTGRDMRLPIVWRFVGASIMGDTDYSMLEGLGVSIEPSRSTASELADCYAWADVMVLPSRWEGLPLTILEAMQLGTVVCATAVGAVSEAIDHGKTGFLLSATGTGAIVTEAVQILKQLWEDPSLLLRISTAASTIAASWSWEEATAELRRRLNSFV